MSLIKNMIFGATAFVFSSTVMGQSDYSITWTVTGLENVSRLELDVDVGTRFMSSNGIIMQSGGLAVPIAGTCFESSQGGVFCTFSGQRGSTLILELESSLDGTLKTLGFEGEIIESGLVSIAGVQ